MKTAWMPTNHFSRRKADTIPDAVWNVYKAGVIAQYLRGGKRNGVALAMKWVVSQNASDLKPSRRQLESQLKRWLNGVKDTSCNVTVESPGTKNVRASLGPARGVVPESQSRDHTPDTASAESDFSKNSSAACVATVSSTTFTYRGAVNALSSIASNTSSSNDSEATYDDQALEDHDCAAIQMLSEGRIRATLLRLQIRATREVVAEIATGSSPHDASFVAIHEARVDEAAKFLGAIKPGADAFVLYFVLLAFSSDCPSPSGRRLHLLQQGALSASSSSDRSIVHSLVSREMSILEELPNTEQDCLILRILQAHIEPLPKIISEPEARSPTNTDKAFASMISQEDICVATKLDCETIHNNSILITDTRRHHQAKSRHDRHHSDLRPLREVIMGQWSAPARSRGSLARYDYMRRCLSWCCTALSPWSWFDKTPWQLILAQEHLDPIVGEPLGIYWLLWTDWQQNRGHADISSLCDMTTEQAIGISVPSMLFELIRLALSIAPKQVKRSRSHRAFGKDYWETLRRASSGFQRLLRLADVELAQAFTDQFVASPGPMFCKTSVRLSFKVFNQPSRDIASPADLFSFQPKHPAFTVGGRDTVTRWSDDSSDLSSMRRYKRKQARLSMSTLSSSGSFRVMVASLFESADVGDLLGIPVRLLPPGAN